MKISIVIALAPNRSAEVLDSIKDMDYPKSRYEVIVERGLNPSENRNRGAEKARGEIIAFIDDDAVVDKDILNKAEKFFEEHKEVDIVGGPQLTPKDDKTFARISGYALSSKFGAWKMSNRYLGRKLIMDADETMLTSANLFCRKQVFNKVKFDPKLFPGEDPKFVSDAKKQGFATAYFPDIMVYHRRRNSAAGLMKQIYSYGKTRPEKETFWETVRRPFFLVPSIFVVYLLVLFLFMILNVTITGRVIGGTAPVQSSSLLIFLPMFLYLFLDIVFTFLSAISNRDLISFFILPITYPIIHISYGLGMLRGMLRNKK